MTRDTDPELILVDSLEEIPEFANEDEERDWWATHDLSAGLQEKLEDTTAELDEVMPLPSRKAKSRRK